MYYNMYVVVRDIACLPTSHMIATVVELYHSPAVEASLPFGGIGHFQYSMKWLVHWAIDTRVGEGAAWYMSLPITFGASAVLVLNGKRRNKL